MCVCIRRGWGEGEGDTKPRKETKGRNNKEEKTGGWESEEGRGGGRMMREGSEREVESSAPSEFEGDADPLEEVLRMRGRGKRPRAALRLTTSCISQSIPVAPDVKRELFTSSRVRKHQGDLSGNCVIPTECFT
eukprot:Sspe_Gene.30259::Locus_14916_Transcript_1_1_Confidence_1.000_Length_472::g.30259::m.30259